MLRSQHARTVHLCAHLFAIGRTQGRFRSAGFAATAKPSPRASSPSALLAKKESDPEERGAVTDGDGCSVRCWLRRFDAEQPASPFAPYGAPGNRPHCHIRFLTTKVEVERRKLKMMCRFATVSMVFRIRIVVDLPVFQKRKSLSNACSGTKPSTFTFHPSPCIGNQTLPCRAVLIFDSY